MEVTILKMSFYNSLVISFYLDAIFWARCISKFLLMNISCLSKKNLISYKAVILSCSQYFLGYLWSCLTGTKKAKFAKSNLTIDFIKVISTKSILVYGIFRESIFMRDASIKDTYISIRLSSISSCY